MRQLPAAAVLSLTVLLLPGNAPGQDKGEVKLDVVKYDGLKNAVLKHRGKVVLVDLWGEF